MRPAEHTTEHLTRRKFVGTALMTAGAAAGWLPGRGKAAAPAGQTYLDVHVHLGQRWNERGELTPEVRLRWMDAHHVAKAVVLPLISPESWFYPVATIYRQNTQKLLAAN